MTADNDDQTRLLPAPDRDDVPAAARLDHVRRPQPPWRPAADVTECGLPGDGLPTLSRDQLASRLAQLGAQRTAMTTCMTCLSTARRWPTFDADPVAALARESHNNADPADTGLRDELLAIAALIQRHPDEFADLLNGIASTVRLADRRVGAASPTSRWPRRR